jgi:hypothetical protein
MFRSKSVNATIKRHERLSGRYLFDRNFVEEPVESMASIKCGAGVARQSRKNSEIHEHENSAF